MTFNAPTMGSKPSASSEKERFDKNAWESLKAKVEKGEELSDSEFESWYSGTRKYAPGGSEGATAKTLREMSRSRKKSIWDRAGSAKPGG